MVLVDAFLGSEEVREVHGFVDDLHDEGQMQKRLENDGSWSVSDTTLS